MIVAYLERMRQSFKIDISTDDAITPGTVDYEYRLMFEDRTISVLTYNLETLLAEKMQTILARGIANTRMRDFYDVYKIMTVKANQVEMKTLKEAFDVTCKKRETAFEKENMESILEKIETDSGLEEMWGRFKNAYYFVGELDWKSVVRFDTECIRKIIE